MLFSPLKLFPKKINKNWGMTTSQWLHHNARDNDAFTNGLQWYRKTYYHRHHVTRRKFNLLVHIFFIKIDHSCTEFQYSVKLSSDIKHYCIGYIFCSYADRLWWKKCEPRGSIHSPWNSMALLSSTCLCDHNKP